MALRRVDVKVARGRMRERRDMPLMMPYFRLSSSSDCN